MVSHYFNFNFFFIFSAWITVLSLGVEMIMFEKILSVELDNSGWNSVVVIVVVSEIVLIDFWVIAEVDWVVLLGTQKDFISLSRFSKS